MIKEASPQRFSNDPWDADASSTANYCGGSGVMEGQEQSTATLTHTHTPTHTHPSGLQTDSSKTSSVQTQGTELEIEAFLFRKTQTFLLGNLIKNK